MSDMFRQSLNTAPPAALFQTLPTYDAEELVQKGNTAVICLGAQTYILRITKAGKLILTK